MRTTGRKYLPTQLDKLEKMMTSLEKRLDKQMNNKNLEIENLEKEITRLQKLLEDKKRLLTVLTPKEFADKVRSIETLYSDPEAGHSSTDCIMEDQLIAMGYQEGIDRIKDSTRWYA